MLKKLSIAIASAAALLGTTGTANAGSDPYIGDVILTSYNFCPRDFMEASGQILPIAQYSPLFALIGDTYGGDGRINMALPNLNGRVPVHYGLGLGLQNNYPWGMYYGSHTSYISQSNFPQHSHTLQASPDQRNSASFDGALMAQFPSTALAYTDLGTNNGPDFASDAITTEGAGNTDVFNTQPSLTMMWCIAVDGAFPPRS